MTALANRQREFQQALLAADGRVPVGIVGGRQESAVRMFDIYRRAYRIRLVESLVVDFPGLKALLGEDAFAVLARAYIEAHPSTHRSIRWLGSSLPDFAACSPDFAGDPWIGDMARLDWALAHAFDAPDLEPAGLADLAGVPVDFWGSLKLEFHPSLRAFHVSTPVSDARAALLGGDKVAINRSRRRPGTILTWRLGFDLKYRDLEPEEAMAQRLMAEGGDFARMCDAVAALDPAGAAERAARMLQGWLEWGVVGRLTHDAAASA